ncbi:MAG: response regulator, partial [Nitrospirae bacterium]|nr:response regulator [Nitrospirota bacterium]
LKGSETILIAEDNADARVTLRSILEQFGYRVIESVDGSDAIAKFRENKDEIDLCLFDVIMPKKNGKEVMDEIREIKKDIKVIFISGYTYDIIEKKGIIESDTFFLSKPIEPEMFLLKVREALVGSLN